MDGLLAFQVGFADASFPGQFGMVSFSLGRSLVLFGRLDLVQEFGVSFVLR